MWPVHRMFIVLLFICVHYQNADGTAFEFPRLHVELSEDNRRNLNGITTEEWKNFVQLGTDSVNKLKRLEESMLNSEIKVENGSIAHEQLLDSLPTTETKEDSEIAMRILKSSLFIYNTKCVNRGISGEQCEDYLSEKVIPVNTELGVDCAKVLQRRRDGHHPFRRLLARKYKDGFYEMSTELKPARLVSNQIIDSAIQTETFDDSQKNLALVQWSQFIEHDLSKPVVTSMNNGSPIQCCNRDNFKLQPRYLHPACAPLLGNDLTVKYGRENCLNYVRSALAVGSKCTFGAAEQLNQATGYLDLSQLYGFTEQAQQRMRSFKNGQIKSTHATNLQQELLPLATDELNTFCSSNGSSSCFMAGDSRVNSNPFAIVIYTIFMRNHNQIASKLHLQHADWHDERIFNAAKAINVDIYRRIVFGEWLPEVLGESLAANINKESLNGNRGNNQLFDFNTSNEFAVAAIRFYYSMMPNELQNLITTKKKELSLTYTATMNNDILPDSYIFVLKDQIYKSQLIYNTENLNQILESLLHQRAMKMDTTYVESLTSGSTRPTRVDILAFDIQRGRDHGLQGYVKYLEICSKVKVNSWEDLEQFIAKKDISKLKNAYSNWLDIDLIVGGISETAVNDSTVGPTFGCILAEQFSKIRQWQHAVPSSNLGESHELMNYKQMTAADILCDNSDLKNVPQNIFRLGSERNPLISCVDRLKALRL